MRTSSLGKNYLVLIKGAKIYYVQIIEGELLGSLEKFPGKFLP